ncbi:hypothetical protein HRI_002315200 [Hibiscus trionum]|uniref:Uncharacterized protein n=1 Tax=Hibiscus trionum TaxID=183268 RepID=A0A9W7HXU3_HIBTR|nr:hypothetical protein HRI_002315200 [Hibiscus trionum]
MRRRRNDIQCLCVGNNITKDMSDIRKVLVQHFRKSYNDVPTITLASFDVQFNTLEEYLAKNLEVPFSEEEAWLVINSADGTRAPGPDGFNLNFFKK